MAAKKAKEFDTLKELWAFAEKQYCCIVNEDFIENFVNQGNEPIVRVENALREAIRAEGWNASHFYDGPKLRWGVCKEGPHYFAYGA